MSPDRRRHAVFILHYYGCSLEQHHDRLEPMMARRVRPNKNIVEFFHENEAWRQHHICMARLLAMMP